MPSDLDSLQIKINADSKSAGKAIDNLANKLTKLSNSLAAFDSSKFNSLTSGLKNINAAAGGMGKESTSGFAAIANGLSRLNKIDPGRITAVSNSLTQLAGGLNANGGATFDASGLVNTINSISKLGGKYATQAAQNLAVIKTDVISFVNGLNSAGGITFDYNSLSEFAASFNRLGRSTSSEAAKNLKSMKDQLLKFISGLNGIGNIKFDMTGLADLANGISRLGGKAATQAISNIPQLASAMENLMKVLSRAPAVSQNLINMTNALANLARTGASSGRAANSLSGSLNTYTKSTSKASRGTKGLASAIGKMYATYWLLFRAFGKLGDAIDISSKLTEVQNVVDVTFGDMADKVDEFAETSIEKFGMSELSLKQYASRFQAMGTAMNIDTSSIENANKFLNKQTGGYIGLSDSMSDVSLNLTKLTADMASFYNMNQEDVAKDLESIFTGMTRPLRVYGLDLTEATLSEWAMRNGLDANIKSMSQAEKTMLRYQYVLANSTAAQGDFERTQNTWANQTRILRQQLEQLASVIGGTFINALKPLVKSLNAAMSHIIAFAKTVSNSLGKIFGWTYEEGSGGVAQDFEDAAIGAEDIADSTGTAAKNIKKLKEGLRAFDELNVINLADDDDGGGSGSGAGGAGVSGAAASGGKWTKTDDFLKGFESQLDNLYKLGSYISDKLSDAMESIDWDSIYKKARNFGKGLADFLNGLITPRLFANVGKTIANSLNTALNFLNTFGKTFDWGKFGKSLVAGITSFIKNWDAKLTAKTFSTFAKGFLKALTGAITGLMNENTFEVIGKKIVDLICGIDWSGIAWNLYKFFKAMAKSMSDLPSDFARGIAEGILEKITGVDGIKVKTPKWLETAIKEMFITLNPLLSAFRNAGTIVDIFFPQLSSAAKLRESIIQINESAQAGITIGQNLIAASDEAIRKSTSLSEEVTKSLDDVSAKYAYIGSIADSYYELSSNYGTLTEEQRNLLQSYAQTLKENVNGIEESIDPITGAYKGTKEELETLIEDTKNYYIVLAAQDALVDYGKQLFSLKHDAGELANELNQRLNKAVGSNGKSFLDWQNQIAKGNDTELINLVKRLADVNYNTDALTDSEKELYDREVSRNGALGSYMSLLGDIPGKLADTEGSIGDVNKSIDEATKIVETHGKSWVDDYEVNVEKSNIQAREQIQQTSDKVSDSTETVFSKVIEKLNQFKENSDSTLAGAAAAAASAGLSYRTNFSENTDKLNEDIEKTFDELWKEAAQKSPEIGSSSGLLIETNFTNALSNIPGNGAENLDKLSALMDFKSLSIGNSAGENMGNNVIDGMSDTINQKKDTILKSVEDIMKNFKFKAFSKSVQSGLEIGFQAIPQYSIGGFPEDGLFMANHTELVGQFANGHTAVANNDMITAGIEEAAYRGFMRAMSNSGGMSANVTFKVEGNRDNLFKVTREEAENFYRRTGRSPYPL